MCIYIYIYTYIIRLLVDTIQLERRCTTCQVIMKTISIRMVICYMHIYIYIYIYNNNHNYNNYDDNNNNSNNTDNNGDDNNINNDNNNNMQCHIMPERWCTTCLPPEQTPGNRVKNLKEKQKDIRPIFILRILRPIIVESEFRDHCAKKLDGALSKSTSFV